MCKKLNKFDPLQKTTHLNIFFTLVLCKKNPNKNDKTTNFGKK